MQVSALVPLLNQLITLQVQKTQSSIKSDLDDVTRDIKDARQKIEKTAIRRIKDFEKELRIMKE